MLFRLIKITKIETHIYQFQQFVSSELESKKEFLELEQKRKEIQQALNALEGGSDDGSADVKKVLIFVVVKF